MGLDARLWILLALNFGISWWNARACGQVWIESRATGGLIRLAVWCGVIQSAIGFSSVFMFPLIFAAHAAAPAYFTDVHVRGALNLWQLTVLLPVLGTGLVLTIQSWVTAYRRRDLLTLGTAAWNTAAELHNAASAADGWSPAVSAVGHAFGSAFHVSGDDEGAQLAYVALLVAASVVLAGLVAGVLLTATLVRRYAGTLPLPRRDSATVARA